MAFISIICPTVRVGGLDILFDSLREQTDQDFELVLVDAFYEKRRELVQREARDRFLAVRHVGLTPNPFPVCSFCAMSNAGIIASTGQVLLFIVDYSRLPPGLVAAHAAFHKADPTGRAGMMGPHRYIGLDVHPEFPRYGRHEIDCYAADVRTGRLDPFMWSIGGALDKPAEPHEADGGVMVQPDCDPKLRMPSGLIDASFFHAKNESVRRERVLEINGWDTDLDGAHLYQDSDFADRLSVKAGVRWMLDPFQIIEIANPRNVFPFMKRLRPHESNREIWQRKKAAGYPGLSPLHRVMVNEERRIEPGASPLRIAMIYGEFSSAIHGPFDLPGLYTRSGLTGSESSFFNLARSLAEKGHEVVVFCKSEMKFDHPSGAIMFPIQALQELPNVEGLHAAIAWNEPDYLSLVPPGVKRFCDQQLNDFGYCHTPNWRDLVDVWVSPSEHHREHVMRAEGIPLDRCQVIPNSVDLQLFDGPAPARHPRRVVWCSSPDRGLHHLIAMWPEIRQRVADAELKVFYRLGPWLERASGLHDEAGRRARYIGATLGRLAHLGVEVVDLVPNAQMARELQAAAVLAYPCDPIRYTEGFGCSVLDAAAAGCVPVISDADALPSVHGGAARIVAGKVQEQRRAWVDTISEVMLNPVRHELADDMRLHALAHSREAIAAKWEGLLRAVSSNREASARAA